MSKKPHQTREALLASLAELDNATEVGNLQAEIDRLNREVASLVSQRSELEKRNRLMGDTISEIHKVLRDSTVRGRSYGTSGSRNAILLEAAQATAARANANIQIGIQNGTHDPATGLPYTPDTKPQRDLSAGAPQVTLGELTKFFPEMNGPDEVGVED